MNPLDRITEDQGARSCAHAVVLSTTPGGRQLAAYTTGRAGRLAFMQSRRTSRLTWIAVLAYGALL